MNLTFDQLLHEATELNPAITAEYVSRWLTENGITAPEATGDQLIKMVEEFGSGALAKSEKGGKSIKKGAPKTPPVNLQNRYDETPDPDPGILGGVTQEMQAFEQALTAGRDRFVEVHGDRVAGIVLDAPNLFVKHVQNSIGEAGANPEYFCAKGERFAGAIFGDL